MQTDQFEVAFQRAVQETGVPYSRARQDILDMGTQALSVLQSKQMVSADWQTTLVSAILIGWLTRPDLFHQCAQYARGNLPGRLPITGKFTAAQRANAIARLGPDTVPRILEMLLKTREYQNEEESAALFGALVRIGDKSAVLPLIELLHTSRDTAIKTMTAGTLGQLRDPRATPPLRDVLLDEGQPTALRATAALSLGELRDEGVLRPLQDILLEETNSVELRKAAARALEKLGNVQASRALVESLNKIEDLVLLQIVVEALGKLGDEAALEPLHNLANTHEDEFIQEAAQEAQAQIRGRLQEGRR